MRRRDLLKSLPLPLLSVPTWGMEPIPEPHFPSRLFQFVWRNWELANTGRMARVLGTSESKVLALGSALGLPPKPTLSSGQLARIYITVIRQNWHLLPTDQLIDLLGWTPEKFAFTLKEDDFLDIKLGVDKPVCPPIRYDEPSDAEKHEAARIKRLAVAEFGESLLERGEPPFAFLDEYTRPVRPAARARNAEALWDPRIAYSYFALYGDPLLEPEADPFPDGYLAQLSEVGINGVWMQAVLNQLAPAKAFPEFGANWEKRLERLNLLIRRAERHGIQLYLYLNEPRAMDASFFTKRPEIRGSKHRDVYAMCTSAPQVRDWLRESIRHIVQRAPGLGGFHTITMSENHTNCYSHTNAWRESGSRVKDCPRCSRRDAWEVIADLHTAMQEGIREGGGGPRLIAYDWGWTHEMLEETMPLLPKEVAVLSISEWDQPVARGGVTANVGEYSMSVPGPGPRAKKSWKHARESGLATMAKIQANNTWEISAVPFIPVPPLVLEHCRGLAKEGISGLLASWTCGGYPSPNLAAASAYYYETNPDEAAVLRDVATKRYGTAAAADTVEAWRGFSQAFREFPYGVSLYVIPVQHGPANLLRLHPTGHKAGMILFPHDALEQWCGAYPPRAVQTQFTRLATGWSLALRKFRMAMAKATAKHAALDLAIAETCLYHFESVANQVEFYILRPALSDPHADRRAQTKRQMAERVRVEIRLAKAQYALVRRHSVLAYEGSNHYYYRPLDLVEKVLNCRQILSELERPE